MTEKPQEKQPPPNTNERTTPRKPEKRPEPKITSGPIKSNQPPEDKKS